MRILSLALILSAASAPALAQQAAPSAQRAGLRMLTWPGKVQPAPQRRAAPAMSMTSGPAAVQRPADLAWSPAYRPVAHRTTHMLGDVTPAQQAAIDAQRAQDRAAAEQAKAEAEAEARKQQAQIRTAPLAPPAASLPTSIYAAPPPAQSQAPAGASRIAAAGPYDQKAHFYSVHRQYGQNPDPIALSPQFLATPSADLADPPPPPPPRIMPGQTATAAQQTAARVPARDSSGSD
jgi:hypothetical protein